MNVPISIPSSNVFGWSAAGAPNVLNDGFLAAQYPMIPASQYMPNNAGFVPLNPQRPLPVQENTQTLHNRPMLRNTALASSINAKVEIEERRLKRKQSTQLLGEQLDLLHSATGDVDINCGYRGWRVHSHVVGPRCKFFEASLEWQKDEEEKVINMHDEDPSALEVLLQYLYTRDTECIKHRPFEFQAKEAQWLANIAIIADKYGQADLLSQAQLLYLRMIHQAKSLQNPETARDALLALVKLRQHDGGSTGLAMARALLLRFITTLRQLPNLDRATSDLLEREVGADPGLAVELIRYLAGAQMSTSTTVRQIPNGNTTCSATSKVDSG